MKLLSGWSVVSTVLLGISMMSLIRAADIKVQEEPVPANSFARVSVKLESGESVLWDVYPEPITIEEWTTEKEGKLHFSGPRGTKYKVVATVLSVKDGKIVADRTRKTVTMAGDPVDPDVDPEPVPVPDIGASPLQEAISAAWRQDPAEERPLVKSLASVYAKYAAPQEIAKYQTWGALEEAMRADATKAGVSGKLVQTQTAVHNYIIKYLPGRNDGWEKLTISTVGKASAKTAFGNVALALSKVK